MRVISGIYKARPLKAPKGHRTHPMGDRVKTALFNTIGAEIQGARVLDAYTGSGSLAIESLSRGAQFAQCVDKDGAAVRIANENFTSIDVPAESYKVTQANISSWLDNQPDATFDIIFVDPPFGEVNLSTVEALSRHLSPKGLMVLSHTGREAALTVNGVVVVDNRMYGEAALSYYRREASD